MAVFGLIGYEERAPADAVAAAVAMQAAVEELMLSRVRQNLPVYEVGIGINTGSAVVGNVGSQNRIDYTVIGDCVNVASRLEEMAKGGEIIAGAETYRRVKNRFRFDLKKQVLLKNKTEPVTFYYVAHRQQT